MRLFAALDLPDEVLDAAALWWMEVSPRFDPNEWRDVPKENWHLTLAFYGEVTGHELRRLAEKLEECAMLARPLKLSLNGYGFFPKIHRPRVFWIGVEEVGRGGAMKALAGCCRRAGFASVAKTGAKSEPFYAHITLARRRGPPRPMSPQGFLDLPDVPQIRWEADRLCLYRSILGRTGARYRLVESFDLAGEDEERGVDVG